MNILNETGNSVKYQEKQYMKDVRQIQIEIETVSLLILIFSSCESLRANNEINRCRFLY